MTDATDYTEGQFIDWLVGGNDMPVAHGNVYVALHTSDPTESGDANEVTAASYSRVSTASGTDWDTSTTGSFSNAVDVEFPTAQENWGTVTHFSLWDGSASTDNSISYSALDTSREVRSGDAPVFRAGDLTGSMD